MTVFTQLRVVCNCVPPSNRILPEASIRVDRGAPLMISRAVELLLIAVVLVGGVLAWRTGRERARLGAEYARLAKAAGDLTVADSTKIHILAIETDEPLHYAWRVYLPPNSRRTLFRGGSGTQSLMTATSQEGRVARVRIRQSAEKGRLQVYQSFERRSITKPDLGDERLADLVHGHEGEIQVEQLGSGGVAVIDPAGSADLLRLVMPAAMQAKAQETLGPTALDTFLPDLFRVEIGPEMPLPKWPKRVSSGVFGP